jgi:hypothetical protein
MPLRVLVKTGFGEVVDHEDQGGEELFGLFVHVGALEEGLNLGIV